LLKNTMMIGFEQKRVAFGKSHKQAA